MIEIKNTDIPCRFEINIVNETFQFEIKYNEVGDFFTVDLYKDHNLILEGHKIILNQPLFLAFQHLEVPKAYIIPIDTTEKAERLTFENFGNNVFLHVGDENVD